VRSTVLEGSDVAGPAHIHRAVDGHVRVDQGGLARAAIEGGVGHNGGGPHVVGRSSVGLELVVGLELEAWSIGLSSGEWKSRGFLLVQLWKRKEGGMSKCMLKGWSKR
jgi:hypothetical protein